MGIKYNNNKISMKSTDAQYPYYNGTQLTQVYYNGNLVWKKYTPLDFTFSGNSVTGYTGSATSFTIPSTYSVVYDIDDTPIFISYYTIIYQNNRPKSIPILLQFINSKHVSNSYINRLLCICINKLI